MAVIATVATTSPLTVTFDGDSVHVPASLVTAATSGSRYAPVVGDRVRVELRTPLAPLVTGKVT